MTNHLIYWSLAALVILALASFVANPQYEKGVWVAFVAISNCLSAALGAKFGLANPNTTPEVDSKGTQTK